MSIWFRTDKSLLSRWWWSVDHLTVYALLMLAVVGMFLVAAASPPVAERIGLSPFYFTNRQMIFMMPTFLVMFLMSFAGRKTIWRASSLVMVASIMLLFALLIMGFNTKGATRWIYLMGFSLQPSEFVKPAFAVSSAWLISKYKYDESFPGHQVALGMLAITLILLLLQPDFGMSFVVASIWGVQVFLSGISIMLIILLGSLALLGVIGAYLIFPHVASRIDRFLDPASGDTYQVEKSLDAFSNGGLWGTGPGHGNVKLHLPDAHADFIFAVAGEEFGMIATLFIVSIFCFIIVRSILRVLKTEDMFLILAVSGLLTQLGVQSLIHMGSSLQLLPAKGMTLPLISYGGSSLLSFGFAMGALLALTSKNVATELTAENRGGSS